MASMRPRVFPAEDAQGANVPVAASKGFNEAAGIPRGRLVAQLQREFDGLASMRPRVFPAEDPNNERQRPRSSPRFNEAAGIPRGRRFLGHSCPLVSRVASMRPRVFPAEDALRPLFPAPPATLQ